MEKKQKKYIFIVSDEKSVGEQAAEHFTRLDTQGLYEIHCPTFEEIFKYDNPAQPKLVLIYLDQLGDEIFAITRKVADKFPQSKIIGLGSQLDVDSILKLLKFGAQDFLKIPIDSEAVHNILYQLQKSDEVRQSGSTGTTITLLSPKGGTGVTLLTVNLGIYLRQIAKNKKIALLDMRPQSGDISTYLNLRPDYTLRDIIDNIDQVDASFLEGATLKHASGLHIFASPRDDQEPLNSDCLVELKEILSTLKKNYDILLIDGCYVEESLLETVLLHSDRVLLLGNLDVPSLKGLVSGLNKLAKYQVDSNQVGIVINRYNSKNHLDAKDFEKKTGHKITLNLPNDYSLCIESVNQGVPISEINDNANLSQQIKGLAARIAENEFGSEINTEDDTQSKTKQISKGLFGWL